MKIACTADLHLKMFNDKEFDENGNPLKLIETLNNFRYMLDYCKNNKIDTVIIAGDINDTKLVASVKAFSMFMDILTEYENIKFIMIPGNHDMASREGFESAIDLLQGYNNVLTIREKTKIDNIFYVPYSSHMIEDIVDESKNIDSDILVTHVGLSDAQLSNGASIKSRLNSSHLKKWKLVITGHYHKPQTVNNVWYTGSLIPHRRDEAGEQKRFLVVDTDTFEVESINTDLYRKYITFVIDDKEKIEDIISEAREMEKDGHFVTVKKQIKDPIPISEGNDEFRIVDEYIEEYQTRGMSSSMSLEEKMKKWLEINNIPDEEWDEYTKVAFNALELE